VYTFLFFQVTNTLQKKLNEVRREKAILEGIIAQEQLHHSQLETKLADIHQVGELSPIAHDPKPRMPCMVALPESATESEEDDGDEDLEREDHMEEEP
jgi:hypothetical protein